MKLELTRVAAALAVAAVCHAGDGEGIPLGRRASGGLSDGDGGQDT